MSSLPSDSPLRLRAVSELTPRSYTWLWTYRLALGEASLFEGDPGLGKSLVALDLCARLSRGLPMPDGSSGLGPANSLVLHEEDGAEDAIRGRLEGLGADMSRVFVVDRNDDEGELIALPDDTKGLVERVKQVDARLVVLDPILSFLGPGVNVNHDQSVRKALRPLRHLARQHRFVPLMVRNLNKNGRQQALYRGSGSLGFLAASRSGWLFGPEPQNGKRFVLAEQKNNFAPGQPSLAYTITSRADGLPQVSWAGPCQWTRHDLVGGGRRGPAPVMRDRARDFLAEILKAGPCATQAIWEAAKEQGLSLRTLQRARDELGIRLGRRMEGKIPVYYWLLPRQQLAENAAAEGESNDLAPWLRRLEEEFPPHNPLDEP
jgi:hypothetical protein